MAEVPSAYCWAMYLVASSEMRAIREMFLATTFVLCDAAIYHAGVPGTCRAPVGGMETFRGCICVTLLIMRYATFHSNKNLSLTFLLKQCLPRRI